ncbi:MAG: RNA polymerase sigma factor [Acidimicrobiales bacterium]
MTIPFDTDWQRVATSPDAAAAVARWATLEPGLASADLDTLRCRARSRDVAQSDATLAALLRVAADDLLARRVIVEALMGRLVSIAATLARRSHDPYDDVLVELAGWAWELAATTPADRWAVLLAPQLARLAKRRYLGAKPVQPVAVPLGELEPPATTEGLDDRLGIYEARVLLERAAAAGIITPTAAQVLDAFAVDDASDPVIAQYLECSEAATKKTRLRALARLRKYRWAIALRAA